MFDSGFGGLTVARALIDLLPAEDLVYIGDTARYPYGPRPAEEVRRFARQLATSLVASLQLIAASAVWAYATNVATDGLTREMTASVISLSGGALFANVVSVVLLVVETVSFQRR